MLRRGGKSCVCDWRRIARRFGIVQRPSRTIIHKKACCMKTTLLAATVLAAASAGWAARPAHADDTGIAAIHSWVKVGRKTCMVDHFHEGSGTGKTRQKAETGAKQSWTDFTAWEYGSDWARYSISESKQVDCSRNGASDWSCQVSSRPCRPR
jgi:hypothetical protein